MVQNYRMEEHFDDPYGVSAEYGIHHILRVLAPLYGNSFRNSITRPINNALNYIIVKVLLPHFLTSGN